MEDNKKILLDLQAELEREKEIVENLEAYNRKNKLILLTAKMGLALHKSAPYIICEAVLLSLKKKNLFMQIRIVLLLLRGIAILLVLLMKSTVTQVSFIQQDGV